LVGQVARLSAFTYHLDSWTIILKKDFLPNRKRPKKSYKKKDECQLLVQTSGLEHQGYQKGFS